MKIRTLVSVCLGLGVGTATAQEALRSSIAGEAAATARRQALEQQYSNVQFGRAKFLVGTSLLLEANDNINYSDADRQRDFILNTGINILGTLPITEVNALYATLDAGYSKYINFPQYDRLLVQPGSQLGLDMYIKNVHLNLHDEISVTEQPVAQGTISGTANYGDFSNTAGVTADWDLNKVVASFGVDHINSIATDSSFSYLDRRSENIFGRAAIQITDGLTAGPEASAGVTAYDQHVLNDSLNYSFGGFAVWEATAHLHIEPRAGITIFSFSPTLRSPAPADTRGYYLGIEMSHRLNDFVSYTISGGRQIRLGINSELISLWNVNPRIDWKLIHMVGLTTHFIFENGTDSGVTVLSSPEQYTLLGGGISLNFHPMEKLLVGLNYDYSVKNSSALDRDYHQNRIQLQLQYTF